MVSSNDLKTGIVLDIDNVLWQVIEFQHVLQNKTAYVRVKMKNLRTGAITETALNNGVKLKKAFLDKKTMQYLYDTGTALCFMDNETYEQVEIGKERLEQEMRFLVEGMNVEIVYYNDEVLGVNLPDKVTLKVTKCDPAVKGDTKTNALKDAYVETGLLVKVPMFIEEGEAIIISTETGKYTSRA